MNELAVQEKGGAVVQSGAADLMSVIARAASDDSVDVEKMERLFALKERMDAQERQRLFSEALARIQAQAPRITQHGRTDKARFAKLEDIDHAMRPLMADEGFSLSFDTQMLDGKVMMIGKLAHSAGHSETKSLALPIDNGPGRNSIQAMGSTVSYGRRYLTKMFFNIIEIGEDNDGNGAAPSITRDQADTIESILSSLGWAVGHKNRDAFLKWLRVEKVAGIQARDYAKAVNFLQEKQKEFGK